MLRPFAESDMEDLVEVFRANVPDYFAADEEQDLIHYLGLYPDNYIVWEAGEKAVSGGGHSIHGEDGHISWFLVDPKMHGNGIGNQLVEHSINQLIEKSKVTRIIVRTSQLVYKFFEKFGFEVEYTEKDYWGEGLDLVYMKKEI